MSAPFLKLLTLLVLTSLKNTIDQHYFQLERVGRCSVLISQPETLLSQIVNDENTH